MFTLHNGDCLEYMKSLQSESIDCIVTDPPYGIDYAEWDKNIDFLPFLSSLQSEFIRIIKPGAICFVWIPKNKLYSLDELPFDFDVFIETKNFAQMRPHNILLDCWVPVLMFSSGKPRRIKKKGFGKNWYMVNTANTSFNRDNPRNIDHPTVKDVSIIRYFLEMASHRGETVFDPFMGSGTTGVACLQTGRHFLGCELKAEYFSIAESRIKSAALQPGLPTPSNNRLHLDVGDSPAQQALFTPEADSAEGKLPAPAPRR